MNRLKALLVVLLVLGCAVIALTFFSAPRETPQATSLHVGASGADGRPYAGPVEFSDFAPLFWARRVGMEALALSGSGTAVEFLDETGKVLGSGRSDPSGAFRGTIPAGAGSLTLRFAAGSAAVWRLPAAPGPLPGILLDRAVLRPGDRVRACLRLTGGADPPPDLRFEPGDPSAPAAPFVSPEVVSYPEVPARWRVYETRIPDDIRAGTATFASGNEVLEIPIVGRCPPPDDGGGGTPDSPPAPPEPGIDRPASGDGLLLERKDGRWNASGPADTETILFYAESGGRLLAHQAVAAIEGAAATALPLGDDPPAKFRVTAIASTPRGYLEAFIGDPGKPARTMDDDPVLSRFLAERPVPDAVPSGPAWIHEGDAPGGLNPAPPSRQGFLARTGSVSLVPGVETAAILPADAEVRWTVHPPGASGALRIRGGGEILAETRVGPGKDGGVLRTADPAPRSLLVESGTAGIESVSFEWTIDGKAGMAPSRPGGGVVLGRVLPGRGRTGEHVEYRIVIRWTGRSPPTEVVCPIPRGAVLAEDGWSIRERAPAGTRVETPDGAVILRIPAQEPGEAVLSVRIRLAWPGRYAAPAVVARSGSDPALSEAGFLVIE